MIVLRPYQEAAKAAVYDHLRRRDDNPCVVIPTGWRQDTRDGLRLQGRRGAVGGPGANPGPRQGTAGADDRQAHAGLPRRSKYGVYSAGLKRRDTEHSVIVAGIQSVYRKACELGGFNLIIVDEAHLIPPDGEGMYQQFLADAKVINPEVRVIGLTATPFRMKSGMICAPENILNAVCYEVGVRELIRDGFLCPLVTKAGREKADVGPIARPRRRVHGRRGRGPDGPGRLVTAACAEIVGHGARPPLLPDLRLAASSTASTSPRSLRDMSGQECGFVCGETPTAARDELLGRFRAGDLRYLANVNVLTTGFDAPNIDCVALLRPTMSPGLFYQMCGRGFRLHSGKQNCLVLDFGGNVMRHGPVDEIKRPRA